MTLPHIPWHTPFESVEWNRHRNLKAPFDVKVRLVVWPVFRTTFFDQFFEYAVTVWEAQTAFHTTLVPLVTETEEDGGEFFHG